jgi:Holliday junction DNA helicase RuvA
VIAKLTGFLDGVGTGFCVIDVGGVGYRVDCSARTLRGLAPVGQPAELWITTRVRDDVIRLYGFRTEAEQRWFDLLQDVQGVGAKIALNLLSALSPDDLARAILSGDRAMMAQAEGVGLKLAQRLCNELKDRIGDLAPMPRQAPLVDTAQKEAVSALVNLGIRPTQAEAAIAKAALLLGEAPAMNDLIKAGLKELAR